MCCNRNNFCEQRMLQKLPEHLLEQLVVSELRLPEYRKYGFRRLWK